MSPISTTPAAGFDPAWWAAGPNAQTLCARVLRSADGPTMKRERMETPDGDFVDVDWGPEVSGTAPLALVLHGLEGSSRRRYVLSVCRELLARGTRPVALNFRGCSGEPNKALRFYHSGDTVDTVFVLSVLRERFPERRIGALGFSLGGNVLLKAMGERPDGGAGLLDAAAVMSVPYDLRAGCSLLERSRMGRMYARYFLRSLRRKVLSKEERLAGVIDVEHALRSETIREFDERVTAPLNGFVSASEYYERCASAAFLESVRVPTLLLHAVDDPFLPSEAIPRRRLAANETLHLTLLERGGHVGFLAGQPWRPVLWGDRAVASFLADRLSGT